MGCRRQAEGVVYRKDFGSVCSRWGQYFFESSVQTTIALLMLGLNLFLTLMKPVDHVKLCARHVVGWNKMVVSQGRFRALPFWRSTEGCGAAKQRLRNHLGLFLSMHSTLVLLLRAVPNSRNSRTFAKGNKEHLQNCTQDDLAQRGRA